MTTNIIFPKQYYKKYMQNQYYIKIISLNSLIMQMQINITIVCFNESCPRPSVTCLFRNNPNKTCVFV